MSTVRASVTGFCIHAQPAPEQHQPARLYAEVEIRCPACADHPIRIPLPGHHLRAIRDLLIEWCDRYPAETTGGTLIKEERHEFTTGGPGSDPSLN